MTQYLTTPVRRASLFLEERFTNRSNPTLNTCKDDLKKEREDDSSSNGDPNQETNAVVNIYVGGLVFRTYERSLKCIPKLANLDACSPHYISSKDAYFFDRNPGIFQSLLDYHRLGEIHIPKTMCAAAVQKELEYWGLDDTCLSKCCKKYFYDSIDEVNTYNNLQQKLENLSNNVYLAESSTSRTLKDLPTWRNNVWQFLNDTHSSMAAKMWDILYLILIVVSIATFFLETLPSCRISVNYHNNSDNGSLSISQENDSAHSPKITTLMNTQPHLALSITDISCLVFFTIEFCLRIFVCPRRLSLLKKASTIIDLLYLIPAWFATITDWVDGSFWHSSDRVNGYIILQALKACRVFRLARFVRHCRGLRMLCLALEASKAELYLLGILVIVAMTIFASCIYCAELFNPNSFDSAFIGLWWALITLTTVGYGDYFPESWPGYIVASLCALTGLILLGLPIPIIAGNFHAYYGMRPPDKITKNNEVQDNKKKKRRRRKKKKKSAKVQPV